MLGGKDEYLKAQVSAAFKEYLSGHRMTLLDISKKTGIDYTSIKKYSSGASVPSLQATAILIDFGVPIVIGKPQGRAVSAVAQFLTQGPGNAVSGVAFNIQIS